MEIILTNHAIDEYNRHLKSKGNKDWSLRNISNYFSKKPMLVKAITYTLPRKGKISTLRGSTNYLARMSWLYSRCFLLIKKDNQHIVALTSISGREFRSSVRRNIIREVSENEIFENIIFK